MANDTRFFDALLRRVSLSIHTMAPARVIRYYPNDEEADVELLFLSVDKNGATEKYPMIERAPVLGMRYKMKSAANTSISGISVTEGSVNASNTSVTFKDAFVLTPHLQAGDIVFVGFSERAMDNLQKQAFDPDSHRMHDVRDAVILGILGV